MVDNKTDIGSVKTANAIEELESTLDITFVIGKVYSATDNLPLPGAIVKRKSNLIGNQTGVLGQFTLSVPTGIADTLVITCVGYETKEIAYGTSAALVDLRTIKLNEE